MTLVSADRIRETATTAGTGTFNLLGAVSNYRGFVAGIGDTNTCYYCIVHRTVAEWEVGIGTVTDSVVDTLSRDTVLSSSTGSKVSFSAGTKDVFVTSPANGIIVATPAGVTLKVVDTIPPGGNNGIELFINDGTTDYIDLYCSPSDHVDFFLDVTGIYLSGNDTKVIQLLQGIGTNQKQVTLADAGITISTELADAITIQASASSDPVTIILNTAGITGKINDGTVQYFYVASFPSEASAIGLGEGVAYLYAGTPDAPGVPINPSGNVGVAVNGITITFASATGKIQQIQIQDTRTSIQADTGGVISLSGINAGTTVAKIAICADSDKLGFFCTDVFTNPVVKQTVTGASRDPALASALTKLALYGLITDSHTVIAPSDICWGRLTLETGVAVSTSDQTAKTTIYFTPFRGNTIALYNGTTWDLFSFTEKSLALGTLTSAKNYDVFIYNNSGTLTLEFSAAWTNDTTRADALALQDGIYCKSGALTRRYLGTFRTTATTTTEDSGGGTTTNVGGKRFLWNYYNRIRRAMKVIDTTGTWVYQTDTWRQARATAGNQVEYVCGINEVIVDGALLASASIVNASAHGAKVSIGLDSTTTPSTFKAIGYGSGTALLTTEFALNAPYSAAAGLGYHFLAWLERGADVGCTWWGSNDNSQAGMVVWIEG